jgi:hypothetical protein
VVQIHSPRPFFSGLDGPLVDPLVSAQAFQQEPQVESISDERNRMQRCLKIIYSRYASRLQSHEDSW